MDKEAARILDILATDHFPLAIEDSIKNTVYYPENCAIEETAYQYEEEALLEIVDSKAHDAAYNHIGMHTVCILNFASAKHPGGGFLKGSRAQEEDLCRAMGLYPVLAADKCKPFYTPTGTWKYSNRIIYNPNVPMLGGGYADVLTCAAPNLRNNKETVSTAELEALWVDRWTRVLNVASLHSSDMLILGAWGCGVFGNPPILVAKVFMDLWPKYSKNFEHVIFAIPKNLDTNNYDLFKRFIEQKV